jgi:hypothetical protein
MVKGGAKGCKHVFKSGYSIYIYDLVSLIWAQTQRTMFCQLVFQ